MRNFNLQNLNMYFLLMFLILSKSSFAKTFKIGVENLDYKPFYYVEDGKYQGFTRELLDTFASEYGHTFEYIPLPVARLLPLFLKGEVDFKYPDNLNWKKDVKKDENLVYSLPVDQFIDGVLVLPENEDKPLYFFRKISTVKGFTPFPLLPLIEKGDLLVKSSGNFSNAIELVLSEKAQGVFGNIAVTINSIENDKITTKLVLNKNLPFVVDYYHLSTIKYPQIIDEFNQFLKKNKRLIKDLKEKY